MILFLILIILASVVISFFILIQNPKGGGLSGSIAGFSTQFMGVKQTTDVLEKGTWVMAIIIAVLSLFSAAFFSGSSEAAPPTLRPNQSTTVPALAPVQTPENAVPLPNTTPPAE